MLTLGRTGSGKTQFNVVILKRIARYRPVAILDTKGEDALILPNSLLVETLKETEQWKPHEYPVLVYRPNAAEQVQYELLDDFLQSIYELGNIYTYIDELSSLKQEHTPRIGLINLLSRGRSRHRAGRIIRSPVGMSTQRPRRIPVQCYTEASRIVSFALSYLPDRKAVAEFTNASFLEPLDVPYSYRVYDVSSGKGFKCKPLRGIR